MVEVKDREFLALPTRPGGTRLAYTPPKMPRLPATALILLATSACGGDDDGGRPDSAVVPGDAWVELGTGVTEFEELAADGEIVLVAGPQGGHHFIVSARMRGLQPGDPTMPGTMFNPSTRFSVWNEAGDQLDVNPPPYRLGYEEAGGGVFVLPGGHIIQVREEEVAALYGERVKIRVELEDASGTSVTDERWVRPIEDTAGPGADAGLPAAWVEIGTGEDAFEAIAPEGDLVFHAGPQGGHHLFLHARMLGLSPDAPSTSFTVWTEGGDRVDFPPAYTLSYEEQGEGVFALPYGLAEQVNDAVVAEGDRVRVAVELTDGDGIQVTDERWVQLVGE